MPPAPRTVPRREQYIRASRAQDLGLVRMLVDDGERDAKVMATALRSLPHQSPPSEQVVPGLLHGRRNVVKLTNQWLARGRDKVKIAAARD